MISQIPLDLNIAPDFSDGTFLRGACNHEAYLALENNSKWANQTLAIIGPKGCGKTHLGNIWALQHDAICLDGRSGFVPKANWNGRALWIDNASRADEFTLFTLINLAITSDISALLLCDRTPPPSWKVEIPDLKSRLSNVQITRIHEPDEELLASIVRKLFKDRGLKVSDNLISYLLSNTDRSVNALRMLVKDLDEEAAQQKVNVTRSFAAKFLQKILF